jgi:hypothetical protein
MHDTDYFRSSLEIRQTGPARLRFSVTTKAPCDTDYSYLQEVLTRVHDAYRYLILSEPKHYKNISFVE